MYSTNNPHGAGPSSRPVKPVPARRQAVTFARKAVAAIAPAARNVVINITDSDSEINLVDSSDSDIELIGTAVPNVAKRPPPHLPPTNKRPIEKEVIDLSLDDGPTPSLSAVIEDRRNDDLDYDTDTESIPEGFELWEPTAPIRITRTAPVSMKQEPEDLPERELAWRPPKMDWFREDCTGASSAGAFIEPVVPNIGTKEKIALPSFDFGLLSSRRKRPRWIMEKSGFGLMRNTIPRLDSGILFKDEIVPIPGMDAARGAVNCIAQSSGYIAIGRTYEEDATYDGGIAVWKVRTKRVYDVPAHMVAWRNGGSNSAPPRRKPHSIGYISFDPADNTTFLSSADDNRVQLWHINEEEDIIEEMGSGRSRKPGSMSFSPEGNIVAVGCADGLQLYDTSDQLKPGYNWGYKSKGQQVVSIAWGVHRSRRTLAAGTQDEEGLNGRLVFINTEVGKMIKGVNAESCSTLALDPSGTILAFTGSGRGGKPHRHVLRLYDPHRTDWYPTAEIGMPSSKTGTSGEILDGMWSPDGIHIAYARDNNTIDVFDTRWLGQRQSMLVFKHDSDSTAGEGDNAGLYGVQGIAWFGNDKLVSGGADHCVRVWDVRKEDECRVLATLGGPIGYLGGSEDPELFPIVAGDQLGNAYYLPNRLLVDRS